jgi:hypothetical protein
MDNQINNDKDLANDQPWLYPMPGENARWFSRFSKFVEMGPLRSIYAVYASELTLKARGNASITRAPGAWYTQARLFEWKKRAEAFDEWRRKEVFAVGNAQDIERVKKLNELADKMYAKLIDEIGAAEVNDRFVAQFLAVLDLLAKHTGGYPANKVEITGKDGKAIEVEETKVNVVFYMPEIEEIDPLDAINQSGSEQPGEMLAAE